ncbi:MAG TPA: COX15/CtaA family protein [Terriglobales bacterium]|nr:COX15/CtaA family protein [Terriglobales bacterium]
MNTPPQLGRRRWYAGYAWAVLAYTEAVILWGAYVRVAGAGSGCGVSWPLCDGQFLPHAPQLKMLIEFFHRVSSGVDGIAILLLLVGAFWLYPKGDRVRRAAGLALVFLVTEALLGAALVLFGWVGTNASAARAAADAVHLTNTLLLLAAVGLTAAYASGLRSGRWSWSLLTGLAGVVVTAAFGVMAALADTLYPSTSLAAGMSRDFSAAAPSLVRLRTLHPVVAVLVGLYLLYLVVNGTAPRSAAGRRLGYAVAAAVGVQWCTGALDLIRLTPASLQVIHLFTADCLWLLLVLYAAALAGERAAVTAPPPAYAQSC